MYGAQLTCLQVLLVAPCPFFANHILTDPSQNIGPVPDSKQARRQPDFHTPPHATRPELIHHIFFPLRDSLSYLSSTPVRFDILVQPFSPLSYRLAPDGSTNKGSLVPASQSHTSPHHNPPLRYPSLVSQISLQPQSPKLALSSIPEYRTNHFSLRNTRSPPAAVQKSIGRGNKCVPTGSSSCPVLKPFRLDHAGKLQHGCLLRLYRRLAGMRRDT